MPTPKPGAADIRVTGVAGGGVGTYRESPALALTVPITASTGVYRSVITLSAS